MGRPELVGDDLPSWQAEARCLDADPGMFFPEDGGSTKHAREFCQDCPVREQCLELAVVEGHDLGVWGGTTPKERARLRAA